MVSLRYLVDANVLSEPLRPQPNPVVVERLETLKGDTATAEWHGAERARLVSIGRTPPHLDGQIASIAATNGLILVTFNLADFQHFRGLQVEDWRS